MTLVATRLRFLALFVSLMLLLLGAAPVQGQNILAQWNFDTGDPNGNGTMRTGLGYEAQIVDPNATAIDVSIGDFVPDTTEAWIEFTDPPYPSLVLRVPPGSRSRNPYEAIADHRYIEFA